LSGAQRLASLMLVASALGFWCRSARADESAIASCLAAAERGQDLRSAGKLVSARRAFLACVSPRCPEMVQQDCGQWLAALDENLPTVVVLATVGNRDVWDVNVSVDGESFAKQLDGRAMPIDPGRHVFTFEHRDRRVEQVVVIAEGQKNRRLITHFEDTGPPHSPPPREVPPPAVRDGRGVPTLAYVFAGLGAVAAGSFAYFGITGKNDLRDLHSDCAPRCSDSEVGAVRNELLVADISLGVSIVSLGLATWLFIVRPGVRAPKISWSVSPLAGHGGAAGLRAAF